MKKALFLSALVLLFGQISLAQTPINRSDITIRSINCPEITRSHNHISITTHEGDQVIISQLDDFITGDADELIVSHRTEGYFGERVSQSQSLRHDELTDRPMAGIVTSVPLIYEHKPSLRKEYKVVARAETVINFADFNQDSNWTILHIVRDPNYDLAHKKLGVPITTTLIRGDRIICNDADQELPEFILNSENYKYLNLFHPSMTDAATYAEGSKEQIEALAAERDMLLGKTQELEDTNAELSTQLDAKTTEAANATDLASRAIKVAQQKADEVSAKEADLSILQDANSTLGNALKNLLDRILRLQKTIRRKDVGVGRIYRKLRRAQRKVAKDLDN